MQNRWPLSFVLVALVALQPALAAPRKASHRAVKTAGKPPAKPAATVPVKGGFMVPRAVVLRTPTKAEIEANAVWNVRAGLNVAALQCQYSRFLATTANYNAILQHHGDEFARAQQTMIGHFKRYVGARATNSFDQYTTQTYNSYSTLDAQYNFCEAAALAGRRVLTIPKGELGRVALDRAGDMRASLFEVPLSPALALTPIDPVVMAPIIAPLP
jgi:hypothetical protein